MSVRKSASDPDSASFFYDFHQSFLVLLNVFYVLELEFLTYYCLGLKQDKFLLGGYLDFLCEVLRFYFAKGF